MKKAIFGLLAAGLLAACSPTSIEIEVHNPSAAARSLETVEIAWGDIAARLKDLTPENIVVTNAAGRQIPSQVVYAGAEEPQMLIFQASPAGAETLLFTLGEGTREEYPVQASGRFVPERLDDYAWENNLGAYRIYGPALTNPLTPGIDVWVKSTERLVIDDWYAGKDYHTNKGEGMDAYKVGPTLGGGGSAPYVEDQLWLSSNYEKQQRLDNGPIRTTVKLTYAPFIVGTTSVALEKTISLDANSYFSKMVNVYTGGFETMPIAAGIVLHDVKDKNTADDYITVTEALSDTKQPEIDGDISLGVILPGATGSVESNGHLLIVKETANGIPMEYWSGAGWSQGGVEDSGKWVAITLQKLEQIKNPLLVNIK